MISFDWAKNWEIPKFKKVPNKLYFLPRQNIGVFGVIDEKKPASYFYLMSENCLNAFSKDFNVTITFVKHYLD